MKPQVFDSSELRPEHRISPAQRILDALDGDFQTMRQTAEEVGVHIETLRRLCRTPRVKAPSKVTKNGKMIIYLFTPEDVEEVRQYFHGRLQMQADGNAIHGNNKTETVQ